jgi:predicted ABC-type ATPase
MRKKTKPTCFIIAGPNGAGKTTFALRYLPQIAGCRNFVNADLIAYGLSPFDSLSAQYEAGRLFLREIYANIDKRVDFAFEATLAGCSHISLLKKLR